MKRFTALICLLIFANLALAHPFSSGGGGASSSADDSNLSLILMSVVVLGVTALLVTDIIADNSQETTSIHDDSIETEEAVETGVNWDQLNDSSDQDALPLLAISVFPGDNGRNLATYFNSLIYQGEGLYFDSYSAPVSFGQMEPGEAAQTAFSFLSCQLFISTTLSGLELYSGDIDTPIWSFETEDWDSLIVREASSNFLDFSRNI